MSDTKPLYVYDVVWYRIVDGDSVHLKVQRKIDLELDFGFHVKTRIEKTDTFQDLFRLEGIDAPEVRGEERPQGLTSKEAFASFLAPPTLQDSVARQCLTRDVEPGTLIAVTHKMGKYGRWLVTLYGETAGVYDPTEESKSFNINLAMVQAGHAELYKMGSAVADPLNAPISSKTLAELVADARTQHDEMEFFTP
jgi:endonuclease YncB( thermonuclease family)